eukprot:MONOS_10715.1-p1 / transcript=MONOS_10715.1 / gene=MONOS_10715 / organism=Monocercomonoides_exilis_PA203 / gene_product=unspecified product / transcript_product=unspecified product / location=Mono_scaffold00497:35847-36146(-) / protein_length=100 / sequence_SO=supercontig / SO=protein_coding / is_pseudo=false
MGNVVLSLDVLDETRRGEGVGEEGGGGIQSSTLNEQKKLFFDEEQISNKVSEFCRKAAGEGEDYMDEPEEEPGSEREVQFRGEGSEGAAGGDEGEGEAD